MPDILDQLVAEARKRAISARSTADLRSLERSAEAHTPRGFRPRLLEVATTGPAVIAELKKASPSKGIIRNPLHIGALATQLEENAAAALSVLTEELHFMGSLTNLVEASAATRLPCLRKDFIVDPFQLLEARANRADAVLLIVAALSQPDLEFLSTEARKLQLDVLVEAHDEEELTRAIDAGADIIGINNRDLKTFDVSLETAAGLAQKIPSSVLRVAESGISGPGDIAVLRAAGYQAFLIGEALMRADFPGKALAELLQSARRESGRA